MKIIVFYESLQLRIEKENKIIKAVEGKRNIFRRFFAVVKLFFLNFLSQMIKIIILVFGDSSQSYLVFTRLNKDSVLVCNNSFCQYKKMEKKARFISKTAFVLVLISTIITSSFLYFFMPGKPSSRAATNTFEQTNWISGPTAGSAIHPTNKTGWDEYSNTSDTSLDYSTSGEVKLAEISGTPITETSDTEWIPASKSVTDNTFDTTPGGNTTNTTVASNTVNLSSFSTRPEDDLTGAVNAVTSPGVCAVGSWNATTSKCDWTPANGSTISGNYYNIGVFNIPDTAGYTVNITAGTPLKVHADSITIGTQATLNGNARGYAGGDGGAPYGGSGSPGTHTGSYGSSGGPGGDGIVYLGDEYCSPNTGTPGSTSQGPVRGVLDDANIDMGGGGGGGGGGVSLGDCGGGRFNNGGNGGSGGGGIYLYSSGDVSIAGTITVNGGVGGSSGQYLSGGGAGASGGGILINGDSINISGILSANGGSGGDGDHFIGGNFSGSGGSGRIKLFANSTPTTTGATITATGYNTSNYTSCNVGTIYCAQTTYASSGAFTSRVFDMGANQNFGKITWSATTPGDSSFTMEVRSGDLNPPTDGIWTSVSNGGSLYGFNGARYIQYKATLSSTTDQTGTPTLSDVTITYESTWNNAVVEANDISLALNGAVYYSSGTFASQVLDMGQKNSSWGNVSWSTTQPSAATKIELRAKSSATNTLITGIESCPIVATITNANAIDATGASLTSNNNTCAVAGDQYISYHITLSTTDTSVTPSLDSITINFNHYPSTQSLISSAYNTNNTSTMFNTIFWNSTGDVPEVQALPAGTSLKFKIRTAPDSVSVPGTPDWASGSNWCGPGTIINCEGDPGYVETFYETTNIGETINSTQSDASNDQWMQYKAYLVTTDSSQTPVLYNISIQYTQNTPPCVGAINDTTEACAPDIITASQNDNTAGSNIGKVIINSGTSFQISDLEEGSGADSEGDKDGGTVNLQYFYDAGVTTTATTGSSGNISISDPNLVLPDSGYVMIENEVINYDSISAGELVVTIGRGKWPEAGYTTQAVVHSTSPLTVWIYAPSASSKGDITGVSSTEKVIDVSGLTLDPAADFASAVYLNTAKVRVALNDGNGGAQVGYADSGTFTLDTTAPAYNDGLPLKIDSDEGKFTVYSITENSTLSVRYMNAPNQDSGNCTEANLDIATAAETAGAVWSTIPAGEATDINWTFDPSASGVSTLCFQARDNYNNTQTVISATTPPAPTNMTAGDISYGGLSKYRNLFWWELSNGATAYYIQRCEIATNDPSTKCDDGGNFVDLGTVSTEGQNYCFDKYAAIASVDCADDTVPSGVGLETTSRYCYRVKAEKSDGFSPYTERTINTCSLPTGDLTGKIPDDLLQPDILTGPFHNGSVTNGEVLMTYTSATITWTTDIDSYSLVKYSTDSSLLTGVSTAGTTVNANKDSHSVLLSNLESGTTYYYQVISGVTPGPSSITTSAIKNFITKTPAINSDPETTVVPGRTYANISWTTDAPATSKVYYMLTSDIISDAQTELLATTPIINNEKVTSHNILINNPALTSGTEYSYIVQSLYGPDNASVLTSAVDTFTTASDSLDNIPPVISDVADTEDPAYPGDATRRKITWTTTDDADGNANSYSIVEYNIGSSITANSITAGSLIVPGTPESPSFHEVIITDLTPNTQYAYRVHSGDAFGNLATSSTSTFGADIAPVISALTVPSYDRTTAVISWTTDKPSYSQIEYSTDSANSANLGTATALITPLTPTTETIEKVTQHTAVLTGLDQATDYYFRAVSNDGITAPAKSNISSFTTTGGTAPVITFNEQTFTDNTADITFQSDKNAFLSVMYTTDDTVTTESLDSDYPYASSYMASAETDATITLRGLTSGTNYYYRLTARDIYGNTGKEGEIRTFTTTADTVPPDAITDLAIKSPVSSNLTSSFVTLTWTASGDNGLTGTASSYDIRYSTSAIDSSNWSSATQIDNEPLPQVSGSTEQMTITGLVSGTYYFAIKALDEIPNSSDLSNILTVNIPVARDSDPPTITAGSVAASLTADFEATSATITWDTEEASSSLVDFGEDNGTLNSSTYTRTQGDSEPIYTNGNNRHSVVLTGLAPETTYYFRVKSFDSSGNSDTVGDLDANFTFTTGTALTGTRPNIITGPTNTEITANSCKIDWETDIVSDTLVAYGQDGTTPVYPLEKGDVAQSSTTIHSIILTGLTPSKLYNYEVRSRNGNQIEKATGTCKTLEGIDTSTSIFSKSPTVSSVTASSATISWSTTRSSDSIVFFGTSSSETTGGYASSGGDSSERVLSHSITISGLTASTTYYFRASSKGDSGSPIFSEEYSFNTTAGEEIACPTVSCGGGGSSVSIDTTPPVISNIKVISITAGSATVSWETNEAGYSIVEYGETVSYGDINGSHKNSVTKHTVNLLGLTPGTAYNYKAATADSSGNLAQSNNLTFKTLSEKELTPKDEKIEEEKQKDSAKEIQEKIQELIEQGMDEEAVRDIISKATQPPTINTQGPVVIDITNSSAKISWTTDRKSNSVVKFKAKEDGIDPETSTSLKQYGSFTTLDQNHAVIISGLSSGVYYQYQVQSSDIFGNTGKSPWKEFKTEVIPSIYDVIITDINLNSAVINWKTNIVSSSIVEYGKTIEYDLKQEDKDTVKASKHLIKLNNLETGTTYHFRVRGFDDKGNALASDDYTFKTFTLPQIEEYSVEEVGETIVKLKWKTNVETDAYVKYTDKETGVSKKQGEDSLASLHSFSLKSLVPGKKYVLQIQGRDVYGNQTVSPEIDITTSVDTTPPVITQVRTEIAISSGKGDTVQTIISWKTNEPATSKILWEEGISQDIVPKNSNQEDPNYTTNHIVVITNFKPSTVYRFRAVSSDRSGNEAQSQDFTILIPEEKKSVIQIIISNFEDTFSWVKNLGL